MSWQDGVILGLAVLVSHGLPLLLLWRRSGAAGVRPWGATLPVLVFGWLAWLVWRLTSGRNLGMRREAASSPAWMNRG